MWWVSAYFNDEWVEKVRGPFNSWEEAEYSALELTMDSSDYDVWREEE